MKEKKERKKILFKNNYLKKTQKNKSLWKKINVIQRKNIAFEKTKSLWKKKSGLWQLEWLELTSIEK